MVVSVRVSAETHVHLTLQSSSFPFVPSVCLCWQNKAQKTRGQSCQDEALGYKWEERGRYKWGGRENSLSQGLALSLNILDFIPSSQRASNTWAWAGALSGSVEATTCSEDKHFPATGLSTSILNARGPLWPKHICGD